MTINELYEELRKDENLMEFNPPITDTEITKFQSKNGIAIPPALIELYELFNGGEIYIPGTLIFGVNVDDSAIPRTVKHENRSSKRNALSIPNNYLIFGKLNYGDILCINLTNRAAHGLDFLIGLRMRSFLFESMRIVRHDRIYCD